MAKDKALSRELAFLTAVCLDIPPDPDRYPADMNRLKKMARWHGLRPLVLDYIIRHKIDIPFIEELKADCRDTAFFNLIMVRELTSLQELMSRKGVDCYAYKGSFWSDWLYDDISLREYGDIDLLVPEKSVMDCLRSITLEAGYKPDDYRTYLLDRQNTRNAFFRTDYHIPMIKAQGEYPITLEVHWRNAYPRLSFEFPSSEWRRYSKSYRIRDSVIRGFTNEYQLLLLLVHHSGKEEWEKLKYIADFARYMKKYGADTDWPLVFELAKRKGIYWLLQSGFEILQALGLEWRAEWPAIDQRGAWELPGKLVDHWEAMPPQKANSTWAYFKNGIRSRDGFYHRRKVLQAHLKYFSEWSLLWQKTKWYGKNGA
ncbi:hypothetical protein DYBT9275_00861 [Dyadobacter sp. CECT 9275]|uniref:Nucleotidyltransferase family protein n=1 Tax=Dyadobacter helix TaxID=2822344 RepID=A0A916N4J2_9BACT|nr:nucleotidyltransferase family protein [Dyadobacter sp. CECT 9275]CAG4991948.1 hypothetical protein DYBT9275_00861 [Dyadobacter sp. CECT 9275]